jgi:hypothetical protein
VRDIKKKLNTRGNFENNTRGKKKKNYYSERRKLTTKWKQANKRGERSMMDGNVVKNNECDSLNDMY